MANPSKAIAIDTSKLFVNTNVVVDSGRCVGCGDCISEVFCPPGVFKMKEVKGKRVAVPVRPQDCMLCTYCRIYCPTNAIEIKGVHGELEGIKGPLEAPLSKAFKEWLEIKYRR